MHIQQFVTDSLGDASYLLVDGDRAVVIDPQREVRPYLDEAEAAGARITHVLETHVHNDYVSGGPELAALGAEIVAPAGSGLRLPHQAVEDGDEVTVGAARLRAVHAPGHTHHHTVYVALDGDSGQPVAAFTGGSIIVGGVARTDLLSPEDTEELTRLQWDTAHRLARLLPDDAEVLPTHGSGSFCTSGGGDGERRSRMGWERARNPVLVNPDFAAFREHHLAHLPPVPAYYQHMAPLNRAGPQLYGPDLPRATLLDLATFEGHREAGLPVVDVRSRFAFATAHVPGATSIQEASTTLAYLSWLTPFNAALVLVTEDAAQADRMAVDLLRIGYERMEGYLPFEVWARDRETASLETVDAEEARRIRDEARLPVFDVRFESDQREPPLPGSASMPIDRADEWLPHVQDDSPLVVCTSGMRSAMAGSLLLAAGHSPVVLIQGGAQDLVETETSEVTRAQESAS